ncbi:MAG: hypothetical protein V4573_01635 [Pseudomonadota bacterium]
MKRKTKRKRNVSLCVMMSVRKHPERVLAKLSAMRWNSPFQLSKGFIRMIFSRGFTPSSPSHAQGHFMAALYKPAVRTAAACSLAAAALLATNGAAHAQGTPPATPPAAASSPAPATTPRLPSNTEVNAAFDRADENHDARLTRAEADRFPEVARRFEQIDTNRDTFISREEFTKAVMGTP